MVEQIYPNIFRLEIPLPDNPLRSVNAYIVKGGERHLMVDTAMNRAECREVIETDLKSLQVDLEKTDFFITHLHSDHLGLVPHLALKHSRIFLGEPDCRTINDRDIWEKLKNIAAINGFPEEELDTAIEKNPGRRFQALGPMTFTPLNEGDCIPVGDYAFTPIMTPGHTCGHFCLYEPSEKVLFSGDHLLEDITPHISVLYEGGNPLLQYLDSLNKINDFEVHQVFPGHRNIFSRCSERITELKHDIEIRSMEVLAILSASEGLSAYEVATKMSWDIDCRHWKEYPLVQRWFAAGEALSYLSYLHAGKHIRRVLRAERAFFAMHGGNSRAASVTQINGTMDESTRWAK